MYAIAFLNITSVHVHDVTYYSVSNEKPSCTNKAEYFFHIPINAKVSIHLADYPCFCNANRLHQLCFVSKLSDEMIK